MKLKIKKIIPFIVILILLSIALFFNRKQRCVDYSCLSFPNIKSWKVVDTYEKTKLSWRGLLSYDNYFIRLYKIGGVNSTKADEFTKVSGMKINGLFDTAKSPYAGEISDKIVCPDNLKPQEGTLTTNDGTSVHYFYSFLNDRMQYGACSENQITYGVFSGAFYCQKTSEWYQIELVSPIKTALSLDEVKKMFLNTSCI